MWWFIAGLAVALIGAAFLAPKPQSVKPSGLGDFDIPTAEDGREIPVLFGTRILRGANVVWYGDFKAVAVKKKGGKK